MRSSTIDNLSEYRPYAEYKINKLNAMLIVVSFAIFPSSKILIVTFWSYESLSFKTLKIPYGLILFIHFSILTRLIQTDVSKTMPKMSKKHKKIFLPRQEQKVRLRFVDSSTGKGKMN